MPDIGKFFAQKVERIRGELDSKAARSTPAAETPSLCLTPLSSFSPLTDEDIKCVIRSLVAWIRYPLLLWLSALMFSYLLLAG